MSHLERLQRRPRQYLALVVAVLALAAPPGRSAAQSVSLVMEEAALQRQCADEIKAVAGEARASDIRTSISPRCRAALPKSPEITLAISAYWLLLLLLAAGLALHLAVRQPRR